jgi:hypothetical protein
MLAALDRYDVSALAALSCDEGRTRMSKQDPVEGKCCLHARLEIASGEPVELMTVQP